MTEQARIYRAFQTAKKFGVTRYNIKKEMKERDLSRKDIRNILAGNFVPINFSEPRFEGKIKDLRKIEKDRGTNRTINVSSFYPKYELKSIIRKLKYQKLDEQFRFDKIQTDTPRFPQGLTSIAVPQTNNQTAKIVTPPLPPQPAPKAIQTASAPVNQVTGLTTSETALLSPDEQAIRLRQRGRA